jgi:hypothetical protein
MNVENRKLFANRDARKRLSEMGGIMASSGELMNEVQQFQSGGRIDLNAIGSGQRSDADDVAEVSVLVQELLTATDPNFKEQIFGDARADITLQMAQDKAVEILQQRGFGPKDAVDLVSTASARLLDPNLERSFRSLGEAPTYNPAILRNASDENIIKKYPELNTSSTMSMEESMANRRRLAGTPEPEVDPTQTDRGFVPTNEAQTAATAASVEADPLAAQKAILATDNVTQLMAERSNKTLQEYINSLDPRAIVANAERVMQARANQGQIVEDVFDPNLPLSAQGVSSDEIVMTPEQVAMEENKFVGNIGVGDSKPDVFPNDISVLEQPVVPVDQRPADVTTPPSYPEGTFSDVLEYGAGVAGDIISGTVDLVKGASSALTDTTRLETELAEINKAIPNALDNNDQILADSLQQRKDVILAVLTGKEAGIDVVEGISGAGTASIDFVGDVGGLLARKYQEYVGAGLDPYQAAEKLKEYKQTQEYTQILRDARDKEQKDAEAAREAKIESLRDGETPPAVDTESAVVTEQELTPEQRREAAERSGRVTTVTEETTVVEEDDSGIDPSLRPKARPESGPSVNQPDLGALEKTANNPDLSPKQKSSKLSDQLFSDMTGQKVSMSSKDSVKAYERLFSEMLGMDDKDAEKEMWHNMAMIGFAIAAGESPSALQNIANGMLAGTKMMKEDRATRQKREDAVKTMAIERAFKLEDDATKFTRDLQLANIRATKSGIGTQEPFVDAVRVLAQKGLDAGLYKTMEEALAAADTALRPYYTSGASGGLTDQLTGGTEDEMVEVIQNGKKIKVKKSQLK